MRALVTGASGFVGSHVCAALLRAGCAVTAATRHIDAFENDPDVRAIGVGDIGPDTDWRSALKGAKVVIHAAARTHVINESLEDSEQAYRRVNLEATTALAAQAIESGVKKFIFLSSVKVGGESSIFGKPLSLEMLPAPKDHYGTTKLAAEAALFSLAREKQMEVVILRTPLIYGPGVKGNMLSLFNAVNKGMFLPLKWIDNQRDFIYVHNFVDAIMRTIKFQAKAPNIYYVCDGESVSTVELIQRISSALEEPVRLYPLPISILKIMGWVSGYSSAVKKLTGTLQVDGSKFCRDADWTPPFSMKEGLASTAAWYKSQSGL